MKGLREKRQRELILEFYLHFERENPEDDDAYSQGKADQGFLMPLHMPSMGVAGVGR
jgi:hypothetical protein